MMKTQEHQTDDLDGGSSWACHFVRRKQVQTHTHGGSVV